MRYLLPVIILLLASQQLVCQPAVTDSLQRVLEKQKTNSGRVDILCEISKQFMASKPDSALLFAHQGLLLARKSKDAVGEMMALKQMADVYQVTGNYPQSLELYLQRLRLDEQSPDAERVVVTLISIANLYQLEGDYVRALEYAKKGDSLITKNHLTNYQWYSYAGFGDLYEKMDSLAESLKYNQMAYRLALQLKDSALLGMSLNNTGNVYAKGGNADTALVIYLSAVPYLKQANNESFLCETYQGIARALFSKGKNDSAVAYAKKTFQLAIDGKFSQRYLESASLLTKIYKKTKNTDSAFLYQEKMLTVKDSLFSQEKIKQVQSLAFSEQMRQQEIEYSKRELKTTYGIYALIAASAVFLLIAFLFWRNNRYKQKAFLLLQKQKQETDIQKQKAETTLDELKAAQKQLVLAEKMASLGQLTAGIAHEIQNPLNFVNNFSEVTGELIAEAKTELLNNNTGEVQALLDDVQQNIEKITHHGKRADAIVKGMLQHSRKTTGLKELTDINALAAECLRIAYQAVLARDKGFYAETKGSFDAGIKPVNVAPQDIGRVILNLLNNAFYAAAEKAKTTSAGYHPEVTVYTLANGNMLTIHVCDNGNGIPAKILDKIFQPFFTTKPAGQGTGLGLSLSYDIIQGHGGDIKVETRENESTEFIIELPYS